MAVVPTGTPAWVKSNDFQTYGGHVDKANYQSLGAVNPRTDVTAEQLARMAADLAAVMRTASFCTFAYTCNDTSPAVPTIADYSSMSGSAPTGVRNGDGDASFTWDASYDDVYSVSGDIHFIGALVIVISSTSEFASYQVQDPDANSKNERIRIKAFDDAGAAVQDAQVFVAMFTGPV